MNSTAPSRRTTSVEEGRFDVSRFSSFGSKARAARGARGWRVGGICCCLACAQHGDNGQDRLDQRSHGHAGDQLRGGDAGHGRRAEGDQHDARGRGQRAAPDGDEGRRRDAPGRKPAVQRARQPESRRRCDRLRVVALAAGVLAVHEPGEDPLHPRADLDVRLDLRPRLLRPRDGREPAGQPADRLHGEARVEKDLHRGERLLVRQARHEPGDRPGRARRARRSSATRTSRSARRTSAATSRRSPPRSPTP